MIKQQSLIEWLDKEIKVTEEMRRRHRDVSEGASHSTLITSYHQGLLTALKLTKNRYEKPEHLDVPHEEIKEPEDCGTNPLAHEYRKLID